MSIEVVRVAGSFTIEQLEKFLGKLFKRSAMANVLNIYYKNPSLNEENDFLKLFIV